MEEGGNKGGKVRGAGRRGRGRRRGEAEEGAEEVVPFSSKVLYVFFWDIFFCEGKYRLYNNLHNTC